MFPTADPLIRDDNESLILLNPGDHEVVERNFQHTVTTKVLSNDLKTVIIVRIRVVRHLIRNVN